MDILKSKKQFFISFKMEIALQVICMLFLSIFYIYIIIYLNYI